MSTTAGKTGVATKPAASKRLAHGPGKIGFGPDGPSGSGEVAAVSLSSLKCLFEIMEPHRIAMVVALVLAVGAVVMSTLDPRIPGAATDLPLAGVTGRNMSAGVTKEQAIEAAHSSGSDTLVEMLQRVDFMPSQGIDFGAIGSILVLVLVLYVVSTAVAYVSNWLLIDTVQESVRRMRSDVEAKLQRLPLSYFDGQPRGKLLPRVTSDVDNISQTLIQILPQLINSLLTVLGVMIIMMWISWSPTLITLVSIPLSMLIVPLIMQRSQRQFAGVWEPTGRLNSEIEKAYTSHPLARAFGRKLEVEVTFRTRNEALFKSSFGAQFLSGILMPVMSLVDNLNCVIVVVLGSLQVATGQINIGDVQAFTRYSHQLMQSLTQLASMTNLLQLGVASAERVLKLLDADEMSPEPGRNLTAEGGHVVFEGVTFSYSPNRPLIEHLNPGAEPGQMAAIVGPTGMGKTMLVDLLMRFYDLNSGCVPLDGTDTATVDRGALHNDTGMVLQGTWLSGGTICDSIVYGKEGTTQEEILAAMKAAFVDRFACPLPDNYDIVIDEEGNNVSAGERQLITIARVFLSEPELLIFGGATSSVDTRIELLLQKAMTALRSGCTLFVIAHRLSTIRDADLILAMGGGTIIKQGTHNDLLVARGRYHDLYQSQFDAPVKEVPAP